MSSFEVVLLSLFEFILAVDETSSCNIKLTFNLAGSLEVVFVDMELVVECNVDPVVVVVVVPGFFRLVLDATRPLLAIVPPLPLTLLLALSSMTNGSNENCVILSCGG